MVEDCDDLKHGESGLEDWTNWTKGMQPVLDGRMFFDGEERIDLRSYWNGGGQ